MAPYLLRVLLLLLLVVCISLPVLWLTILRLALAMGETAMLRGTSVSALSRLLLLIVALVLSIGRRGWSSVALRLAVRRLPYNGDVNVCSKQVRSDG
jgi:hypothetical protein